MGTRSTITFYSQTDKVVTPICCIYQMYDGYVKGVGHDLAKWLLKKKLVNGISDETDRKGYANGIGCLIAQFIRDNKKEIGDLYIVPLGYNKKWVDYNYEVTIQDDVGSLNDLAIINITNWDEHEVIFSGSPEELLNYNESGE